MARAMDLSGIPTAPPAGVGVAPNLVSPRVDLPSVAAIRTAARDLPSPTFSPRQIGVMEQILRNEVPEDQIDALLDSVGLDNNRLADYIAARPPSPVRSPTPALTTQQLDVMERIARGNFRPGQIEAMLRAAGLTKDQLRDYVVNRPATPRSPSPPEAEAEGEGGVEVEAGAGCHPEEEVAGATTMEARPGVAAAAVEEGAVVAVAVDGAAALPLDDERA